MGNFATRFKKEDWLPSTSTYKEKLEENKYNGMYYNYDFYFINYENGIPVLDICINHNEYYSGYNVVNNPSKESLSKLFTIDGITPKINEISNAFWL